MYSTEATLESNITPPSSSGNQMSLYNLNNQNRLNVGDYLVLYDDAGGVFNSEGTAGSLIDFASTTGSFLGAVTGLSGTVTYFQTRTGWIYLDNGTAFAKYKIKEYMCNDAVNGELVTSIIEIIELESGDYTYSYDFQDTALISRDNTVSATVDGDNYGEADSLIDVDVDAATTISASASYVATANDIFVAGGALYLQIRARNGVNGNLVTSDTHTATSAQTMSVSISNLLSAFTTNHIEIEVEITNSPV